MDLLEKIQFKAIRLAIGHTKPTPKNVMIAEAKIPPIIFPFLFLGNTYVSRALSNPDHPVIRSLQQMARVREDRPEVLGGKVPMIYTCYADIEPVDHLVAKKMQPSISNPVG
jgi:hypothetical protein